jgi:hypothetical protein
VIAAWLTIACAAAASLHRALAAAKDSGEEVFVDTAEDF